LTATEPLEVSVTDFVTAVPTETLPNERELALKLNVAVAALSFNAKLWEDELALADTVADCVVLTAETVAVNDAVEAPDDTAMLPGTETALEPLASVTL